MKLESQSFWRNIKTLIPFLILAAVGVSIILKVSADFGSQTNVLMANMSTLERILLIPIFILYYPIKLIIPIHFSSPYFIPFENNLLAKLTALCLLVSLLFLLIKLWLKGNYSILLFGIVFYFIMMIPFLQFIPAFDNPIGDRFVYIGSIGLLITLGGILMRLNKILSQNWVYGIVGVLLLFSAFQTYQRTQVWNNSISLYSDCKEKWPNHPYPYYALGVEHTDLNHPQKAIDEFIASEKLGNQSYELYYYKALNYINAQDYLSATTNLELALQRKKTKEALMNLGNCNIILNRAQVAINNFNQALQLDEFYTKARKGRAHAALEIGDTISACEDWDELKEIQMLKKYCH
jgi:tetratricopeptide (TPR) repeat protein